MNLHDAKPSVLKSHKLHASMLLIAAKIGLIAPVSLAAFLALPSHASAAASCAQIEDISGATCEELTYKVDISKCPSKQTAYVTKSCAGGKALVRAKASDATYAFSLSQGTEAWGRKSWTVTDVQNLPAEPMPKMKSAAANRAKIDAGAAAAAPIASAKIEGTDAAHSVAVTTAETKAPAHGISAEGAKLLGHGPTPDAPAQEAQPPRSAEAEKPATHAAPEKKEESMKEVFKGGGEERTSKAEMESLSLAGIKINGYFDMYTQTNFVAHSPISGARYLGNRNGDLQVNTAELNLSRKTGDVTFFVDIGAGENENAFAGYIYSPGTAPSTEASSEITKFLPQAYVSYTPSEIPRLTVNAGKIYTPFGFETPKAKENWLYTHSYAWEFAIPIWHEEINASYELIPEKLKGSVFIFNSWDGRLQEEPNRSPSWAIELEGRPSEETKLVYRGMAGAPTGSTNVIRQVHEIVAQYTLNPKWAFAFEGVYGSQNGTDVGQAIWWGGSLYAKYRLLERLTLAGRLEHYDDSKGGFSIHGLLDEASDVDVNRPIINGVTVGANWDFGSGLEGRLEYRYDVAQGGAFSGFTNASNEAVRSQSTVNLALLYGF